MVRRQLRSPDYYPHLANSYWVRNCANVLLPACVSLGHSVGVSGGTSTTICGVLSGIFTQQFTELHHPWELELCSHYYPDHTEAYTTGILLLEPLAQPALQALSTSQNSGLNSVNFYLPQAERQTSLPCAARLWTSVNHSYVASVRAETPPKFLIYWKSTCDCWQRGHYPSCTMYLLPDPC